MGECKNTKNYLVFYARFWVVRQVQIWCCYNTCFFHSFSLESEMSWALKSELWLKLYCWEILSDSLRPRLKQSFRSQTFWSNRFKIFITRFTSLWKKGSESFFVTVLSDCFCFLLILTQRQRGTINNGGNKTFLEFSLQLFLFENCRFDFTIVQDLIFLMFWKRILEMQNKFCLFRCLKLQQFLQFFQSSDPHQLLIATLKSKVIPIAYSGWWNAKSVRNTFSTLFQYTCRQCLWLNCH